MEREKQRELERIERDRNKDWVETEPEMEAEWMKIDRPNGPVAASLIAGGFGAAVLGVMTTLSEASSAFGKSLNWYSPVGPLSGKVGVTVIAFFLSWLILHFTMRGKNVNFAVAATISFILLAVGLLGTFPPFFDLFVSGG